MDLMDSPNRVEGAHGGSGHRLEALALFQGETLCRTWVLNVDIHRAHRAQLQEEKEQKTFRDKPSPVPAL